MHYIGILFGGDETLLEQYYEGLEVEPYVICSKKEKIKSYIETRNRLIEDYKNKIKEDPLNSFEYQLWLKANPKLNKRSAGALVRKNYEGHIDKDGNITSTYNPNAMWDYYTIGGRWSKYFPLKYKNEVGEIIYSDEATIEEVDWELFKTTRIAPYCYITEEGVWVDRGHLEIEHNLGSTEWSCIFFNELKKYPKDTLVVAIDFHM